VPVGGENELNVEPAAGGIALALLETVSRREMLGLGFDERYGHRLARRVDPHAERVVHAPLGAAPGLTFHNLHGPSRHLAADEVLCPPAGMDHRVDQFGACVGFAQGHAWSL
jgi:hypothetical protein